MHAALILVLQMDWFCKMMPSKSMRMFLEWLTKTQMFNVFISDRLERIEPKDGKHGDVRLRRINWLFLMMWD